MHRMDSVSLTSWQRHHHEMWQEIEDKLKRLQDSQQQSLEP